MRIELLSRHTLSALIAGAFVLALAVSAGAADFAAQSSALDARLESVLGQLASERDRVAREKLPLSRSVAALEAEVAELRRERNRFQKVRDSNTIDLASLRKQVEALAGQDEFIESRFDEFVRDFEGRLHIAELATYEPVTGRAKLADQNVNLASEERRGAKVAVVRAALERLRDQLGGQRFAGEALVDGRLRPGQFVAMGPTVFFVADDGSMTGLVEAQLNAADPVVVPLDAGFAPGLTAIASTGKGLLPLDPTLGKALKIEKARKTVDQYIADGGVVGYVIIGLGVAALLLTGFKAIEIVRFPVADPEEVDAILDDLADGSQAAAAKRAERVVGVAGEMLTVGVKFAGEQRAVLEELLFEKVLRVRPTLERFLPFLAITAAAAPLLGLLGTVIGMINTFQLITIFGTGDAKSLSSGISEALMTTALGLVVAIPTLILHGALSRLAKRKIGLLEELSVAFVNGVEVLRGPHSRN